MASTYLIDGYNLIFEFFDEKSLELSRQELLDHLSELADGLGCGFAIVFDAGRTGEGRRKTHFQGVDVYYTDPGETADDFIDEFVKNAAHPRSITVVTSDRRLGWRVREYGAKTQSRRSFISSLSKKQLKSKAKKPETTPSSPDEYLKVFEDKYKKEKKKTVEETEMERWKSLFEKKLAQDE